MMQRLTPLLVALLTLLAMIRVPVDNVGCNRTICCYNNSHNCLVGLEETEGFTLRLALRCAS